MLKGRLIINDTIVSDFHRILEVTFHGQESATVIVGHFVGEADTAHIGEEAIEVLGTPLVEAMSSCKSVLDTMQDALLAVPRYSDMSIVP